MTKLSVPLVSILIPTYNRAHMVGKAIESALSQTISDIEVIVCDNCSTDNTVEVIQSYIKNDRRLRLVVNETNIGPTRNWKRCVEEARGQYGKILFSDDWISPTFLEKTLPFLKNNESVGFAFSHALIHNLAIIGRPRHSSRLGETGVRPIADFLHYHLFGGPRVMPVSPSCALFRIDDLRKHILTDIPNTLGLEPSANGAGIDLLLFLNMADEYSEYAIINENLFHYGFHDDCFTMKEDLWLYYRLAVCYFIRSSSALPDDQKQLFYRKLFLQLSGKKMLKYFEPLTGQKISMKVMDFSAIVSKSLNIAKGFFLK